MIIIDETAQNTATGTKPMNNSVIFMKILLSSSARSSTLLEAVSPAAIPRMHPSTVSCIALLLTRGCITLSGIIFFSADGSNWWVSYPDLSRKSAQNIIKMWGVKQPGLHKPQGVVSESVYDSVKPSEVRKPADMHTNRNREFGESYDIDMGDVIFRPVTVPTYRN